MIKFYVSFKISEPLAEHWVEVMAEDYDEAVNILRRSSYSNYCNIYTDEKFDKHPPSFYWEKGCIATLSREVEHKQDIHSLFEEKIKEIHEQARNNRQNKGIRNLIRECFS